jgi:hypothetical protein
VLVQYKALKEKPGPNLIRQLEGPFCWRARGTLSEFGRRGGGRVGVAARSDEGGPKCDGEVVVPMVWVMLEIQQRSGDGGAGEGPAPEGVAGPVVG